YIRVESTDADDAAVRHRVARVGGQVDQNLVDLARVHLHRVQISFEFNPQRNVFTGQTPQHALHSQDDTVEVDGAGPHHLAPAEGEQLLSQRGRPFRRVADFLDDLSLGSAIQGVLQHFGGAANYSEQIVEIMSDASGQPADGFHLLSLPQLLFEL